MKLKLDANGNAVLKEKDGNKLPVYVHDDGTEAEFDAAATLNVISRLNGEAAEHRKAKEKVEAQLKVYVDGGITDPAEAKKALELARNLDAKKLVDAGEIDKVRQQIAQTYEEKLAALKGDNEKLSTMYSDKLIEVAFQGSKFIPTKLKVPADMVQAKFGAHFGIDNGTLYAIDAQGQKIYSKVNPGQLADFDEALARLVDGYERKDDILAGPGASGGGAQNNGGRSNNAGQPSGNLGGTRTERQQALAARFPELNNQGT